MKQYTKLGISKDAMRALFDATATPPLGESNTKIQGGSIRCTECEFCKDSRSFGNIRGAFVCKHPDSLYIEDYFREHKLKKMEGFIGFGERFKDKPAIKTSPAWCPKKREGFDCWGNDTNIMEY